MRRLLPKLWAQLLAYLGCILFTVLFAALLAAIIFLGNQGIYTQGRFHAWEQLVSGRFFWNAMDDAETYCKEYLSGGYGSGDTTLYRYRFAEDATNFFFRLSDDTGAPVLESYQAESQYSSSKQINCLRSTIERDLNMAFSTVQERWQYIRSCEEQFWNVAYELWDQDLDGDGSYECGVHIWYTEGEMEIFTLTGFVRAELQAHDLFWTANHLLELAVSLRWWLLLLCALNLLLSLLFFVFLLLAAGHREGKKGIYLCWLDRIPFDLYLLLLLVLAPVCLELLSNSAFSWEYLICFAGMTVVWAPLLLSIPLTFAARAKAGRWWRNTVCVWFCSLLLRLVRMILRGLGHVSHCKKTALLWLGLCALELLLCQADSYAPLLLEKLLLTPLVLQAAYDQKRLRQAGEALAAGNMEYTVPLRHMLRPFRQHGENLNSIQAGFRRAVQEQTKAERFKTELITNVSHDIKTPLTAIVSYVDLLQRPDVTPEQRTEYLSILQRQSARLKKLTEDLVEASKASSGSLPVNLERVDVGLLLEQATGEYADRFAGRRLTSVLTVAEETPLMLADGRLLWRVFDNLLSNICKHALEGTRVYMSAAPLGSWVRVEMKNISAAPLNISSEELMERFVRGDSSRSTEGSGLGLNIARSLTTLQKGSFDLEIDGDLFKVVILLPASGLHKSLPMKTQEQKE